MSTRDWSEEGGHELDGALEPVFDDDLFDEDEEGPTEGPTFSDDDES
jgi:hypothetical protein